MTDARLLYVTAFLRALATGFIGVILGLYLGRLGLDASQAGLLVSAGLAGGAAATLAVTLAGERWGRRRTLLGLTLLGVGGAALAAVASTPAVLGVALFFGMLNGMGRDRGAALALEQAVLPGTVSEDARTRAFAWYNVMQDLGHALGGLLAGLPTLLTDGAGWGELGAFRASVGLYALLLAPAIPLYLRLSSAALSTPGAVAVRLSPGSRSLLVKICALFSLDALGGGFLTTSLLAYFFYERFGVGAGTIGVLFFLARLANAASHLAAAWLAGRIGLVNTMVFTHIPSSLLLATVAFAPSFEVAAALFLLREGLVEMDVPTRQSYVMAVVQPGERTFASGVTALVRLGAWAVAPAFAGLFMQGISLLTPLLVGAALKITYDVLLWVAFRRLKTPEEARRAGG